MDKKYRLRVYKQWQINALRGSRGHQPGNPELTYDEYWRLRSEAKCHYCSSILGNGKAQANSFSIDRKMSGGPYSKQNCVPCCNRCNMFKNHRLTYEQTVIIGAAFAKAGHFATGGNAIT